MLVLLACLLTRANAEKTGDQEFVATTWARASATTGRGCADGVDCNDRVHHASSSYRGSSSSGVDSGLRNVPAEERDGMFGSNTSSVDESAWCAEQRRECDGGCSVFGDMLGSVIFRCDKDTEGGTEAALCVCRDENGAALRSSSRAGAVQTMGAAGSSASSMARVGLGNV